MSAREPASDLGLTGRVVLVTGAGRGLGKAYAALLARHGARVVVHDAGVDQDGRNPDTSVAESVADDIRANGGAAHPITEVLHDAASCRHVVAAAHDHFGRLDGLIHSAGLVDLHDPPEVDEETYGRVSGVNTDAAFWLCSAALPIMRQRGFGRIVLTTSGWALQPSDGSDRLILYCLGKGAQFGLAMALAKGSGHPAILTNVVAPIANTRMYNAAVAEGHLRPESVAGAVTWMASPACELNGWLVKAADGTLALSRMAEVGTRELGEDAEDAVAAGAALTAMAGEASDGEEV